MHDRKKAERLCQNLYHAILEVFPQAQIDDGLEYSVSFNEHGLACDIMINRAYDLAICHSKRDLTAILQAGALCFPITDDEYKIGYHAFEYLHKGD